VAEIGRGASSMAARALDPPLPAAKITSPATQGVHRRPAPLRPVLDIVPFPRPSGPLLSARPPAIRPRLSPATGGGRRDPRRVRPDLRTTPWY